jgi:hypothetical protein
LNFRRVHLEKNETLSARLRVDAALRFLLSLSTMPQCSKHLLAAWLCSSRASWGIAEKQLT